MLFLQDIAGAMVLNDQVVITDTVSCPAGYMVIGDNCGNFHFYSISFFVMVVFLYLNTLYDFDK